MPRRSPASRTSTTRGSRTSERPSASSADALARMKRQGRRDTKPELALRSALHRRGLRYRVDVAVLPGLRRRADIVFSKARVCCFVDGCFWHSCPRHSTAPKANAEWWSAKFEANRLRDRDTDQRLAAAGWRVIRVWEHEPTSTAASRVEQVVRRRLGSI
jgi:DNA mismatch endonuclease (patch repair protein)